MKMEMTCRGTRSGRELSKVVELEALPRVGDRVAVECERGCIVLEVQDVLWQEGQVVRLYCRPRPLGQTSFGDIVLDAAGWQQVPATDRDVLYEVYIDGHSFLHHTLNTGWSEKVVVDSLVANAILKVGDEAVVHGWGTGSCTLRVDVKRTGKPNYKVDLVEVVR